jgi:hypothetical protein
MDNPDIKNMLDSLPVDDYYKKKINDFYCIYNNSNEQNKKRIESSYDLKPILNSIIKYEKEGKEIDNPQKMVELYQVDLSTIAQLSNITKKKFDLMYNFNIRLHIYILMKLNENDIKKLITKKDFLSG